MLDLFTRLFLAILNIEATALLAGAFGYYVFGRLILWQMDREDRECLRELRDTARREWC